MSAFSRATARRLPTCIFFTRGISAAFLAEPPQKIHQHGLYTVYRYGIRNVDVAATRLTPERDMREEPTPTEREVVVAIELLTESEEYGDGSGDPPTYREIADLFGWSSHRSAQKHIYNLDKKGVVEREPGEPRSVRVVESQRL
ncbi:MAG: hypothetical protein ABEN55_06770 [Bradymonadaceae bacterium]